jgi:hypothetical protein
MVRSSQELAEEEVRKRSHPIAYALNRLVVSLSNAVLGGTLLSLIVQAFGLSIEFGVRSLATAALPPIIIAYLAFFTRTFRSPQPASDFKYFFLFAGWVILLLTFVNFVGSDSLYGMLFGMVCLSSTLSLWVLLAKSLPFRSLLSCAYGILSGFLLYILLFGIRPY